MRSRCAACRRIRPVEELVAFWPRGRLEEARLVCRPTADGGRCFRRSVGSVAVHDIGSTTRRPSRPRPARGPDSELASGRAP